jgi:ATP-dependent Clp protease protease subunit
MKGSKINRGRDSTHYDTIFENHVNFRERVIYLNNDINEFSLELFQKAFDELERTQDKPIKIEISSYGGSVYDMLGMIDRIQSSPCTVVTRGFGKIMSAASFILAAGDERIVGQNSWVMIHQMSSWLRGSLSDLKNELEHCKALEDQMNKLYEKLSKGKTKAKTFEKLCSKDCYLTPEEVLKLGLVDQIL